MHSHLVILVLGRDRLRSLGFAGSQAAPTDRDGAGALHLPTTSRGGGVRLALPAMELTSGSGGARRPRLLLYAMYDPTSQDSAPKVRIRLIGDALARQADVQLLAGGRKARLFAGLRWLARPGMGSIDAVYVESSTSAATPFDLAFLFWARLRGRPVGVYFRDAYQRFRELYPVQRRRQVLADLLWRVSLPLLSRVADVQYCPSGGLARVLGLQDAILLPPGTDTRLPFLGPGEQRLVAAITTLDAAGGLRLLVDAVDLVRESRPDVRLMIIGGHGERPPGLPDWVEVVVSARDDLPRLLAPARVCVIPRPITPYTDLAVPVKLMDYLALGKPIVSTACAETRAAIADTGAALLTTDTSRALAAAIGQVLDDPALALALARRARSVAESDAWVWDARATRVIETLVLP